MKKGLELITEKTVQLLYEVNRKYGDNAYILAVNGKGKVILHKGYTEEIATGNANIQKKLKELLEEIETLNDIAFEWECCEFADLNDADKREVERYAKVRGLI